MSFASAKQFCTVNDGLNMAYVEQNPNMDTTLVFLHGNPTSSFLWRNVMAPLTNYRLIAPDLIGMGDSDKLRISDENSYRYEDHAKYLDTFVEKCIGDTNQKIVLVIHDWGSGLGFWWAYRNQERVKGIVYMESLVAPLEYADFDEGLQQFFMTMRSPAGESLILQDNIMIEQTLPSAILRNLTQAELDEYRRPFQRPGEDRRPMLTWPREVPINGTPANVVNIVQTYSDWMGENDIPKLFVNAEPGFLLAGRPREIARTWKNQKEVTVPGLHFIQEDSPDEIARAIDDWLSEMKLLKGSTSAAQPVGNSSTAYLALMVVMLLHKLL